MDRLLWTLGVVVVCGLLCWALLRGWRRLAARQREIARPPAVPADLGAPESAALAGLYVSTTAAGSWQDRVIAHGLGVRAPATAQLFEGGLLIDRQGPPPLFLPRSDLVGVATAPGIAGKVMGTTDGVLVVTWSLGGVLVDTGLRADDRDAQAGWIDSVAESLARASGAATDTSATDTPATDAAATDGAAT